jgi:hypothetical protein
MLSAIFSPVMSQIPVYLVTSLIVFFKELGNKDQIIVLRYERNSLFSHPPRVPVPIVSSEYTGLNLCVDNNIYSASHVYLA